MRQSNHPGTLENPNNLPQFMVREAASFCQLNRIKPKLRIARLTPHMHVRWLPKICLEKADCGSHELA